jgi:AhpD family alkylhydroperoxidase
MKYEEISKETIKFLHQSHASLTASPLNAGIRILVELRVSQINGCPYCCHLHSEEARKFGIAQEKLDLLPAWRHSTSFTPEEKLVLQWAEALTSLDQELSPIKQQLSQIYSERQIVDLTICIGLMNTFNRLEISLRDR